MVSSHDKSPRRSGHSMMEMMIVMSVLAGIAALSWPMLQSPLSKLRLQAAAQEVTTELSKARLKAMQSGVAQVFRFQMNTGKFQVLAASDEDSPEGASEHGQQAVPTDQLSLADHSPLTDEGDLVAEEKELPEGICFEMPATDETENEEQTEVAADDQGWTDLAIFYPNGDTVNAVIGLRSESDLHVDVKLSGLTGTAKVGEAHRQDIR